ncbi:MAG: MATE family efflux transporter [Lachnospiraceae bacterium]|nr:MATE family efflux transporter [Lachnospiraceae bacterium]MBR5712424.1 MATE family efflux transporter [Lachnospiraceae bacterium]
MSKFIGDRQFYRKVLTVAVPIVIQNGISNFVSLLDNIMIGRVGTEPMSGVGIVNQLLFVLYLAIFGALAGPGIYGAQFYGKGDHEGVRHTFRFKMYIGMGILAIGIFLLFLYGDPLMRLYLHDNVDSTQSPELVMQYGREYLAIMLIGLIPFGIEEVYASTLRECGETRVPMVAGLVAVFVNLGLNYVLIFGKFGAPRLGVAGAAIATVISRFVQAGIVVFWTHLHTARMEFAKGAYRSLRIPAALAGKIAIKGFPLMANEILWSVGMAILNQCYSRRGLDAVAGLNIASTITNLFNVVFIAMGSAVAIMVGQLLGAGKLEEAKDTDTKLIAFSVASSAVLGAILFVLAPLFTRFYDTSDAVKSLAAGFIRIGAVCMPIYAFMHATYFTLRTGGKTLITFAFDSVFLWCLSVPIAYVIGRFTGLPVLRFYLCMQSIDLLKCAIGFALVKKGVWVQNLVKEE